MLQQLLANPYVQALAGAVAMALFVPLTAAVLVWYERKLLGRFQVRPGPNRVGPFGLLQPFADIIKLVAKEDITPVDADRALFSLAPVLTFVPAFMVFLTLPFSPLFTMANMNIGLLWILAVGGLGVLGIIMAGWASNSKYALLGGLRSAAQMISYEVPMVFAVISVVILAGSMRLSAIVRAQEQHVWFIIPAFLGFLVYLIAGVAESNRAPFDLPEAESELVAGFHVEYSGARFAFFFLAEYATMFMVAALTTVLFLGGWSGPFLPPLVWFLVKSYAIVTVIIWLRATLPRIRVDHLMAFSWKVLLPISLINLFLSGFLALEHII